MFSLSRPLAEKLDAIVADLVAAVANDDIPADIVSQVRLPRALGGCGVPSSAERCETAFLSTYLRCLPSAEMPAAAWKDAGLQDAAAAAVETIASMGAHIDAWGIGHAAAPPSKLDTAA